MPASAAADSEDQKRAAAARAVELVMPGMVLGLGSGSTANFVLEALAARAAQGLRVVGIPTRSEPRRGPASWA
jgi:ribose 5-phosphate isomerase A